MPAPSSALPSLDLPEPPQLAPHHLVVVAYGHPAPQGSKRLVRGRIIDANQESLHVWREDVKLAAIRAMELTPSWERDYPAVVGHFQFTLPRPAYHHVARDPLRELRENAPRLHTVSPDLDKLLRSTWDALVAAGVLADDNRLAEAWAAKLYPAQLGRAVAGELDRPGVRIVLSGMHR